MSNTHLVIGANRGIGLEIVRQLHERGDSVIATCRKTSDDLNVLSGIEVIEGIDVTDEGSLRDLGAKLGPAKLDRLWVVAGILKPVGLDNLDLDLVRIQFEVNALGPLAACAALRGSLKDGSKIGLLTSRMGSIGDNSGGGMYGYRMSKAALNMAGRSLAHDLNPRGIAVRLLHPGWVRTDMTRGNGHIAADEAARGLIARIDELTLEESGSFVHQNGEALPW